MAISKITLNGVTQIDVTQKTVTSGSMLDNVTALKNDGTDITGNIQSKSASDITNNVGSDNKLTVTAQAGYYSANAAKTIQAASATVSLHKSTVSNHQITVSATKGLSSGYLNSTSQITTDSVSVSASELVSGTKSITSSGTTDVTNYASASVAAGSLTVGASKGTVSSHSISVSPYVDSTSGFVGTGRTSGTAVTVSASELVSGSQTLTQNGTFDVTNLAQILINIPQSEYETGVFTPSTDVVTYNITFARQHVGLPYQTLVVDQTNTYDSTDYTNAYVEYKNWQGVFCYPTKYSTTANLYGELFGRYRSTNASAFTSKTYYITNTDTNQTATSTTYPRYWVSETGMRAEVDPSSYWRTGRTYRWVAFWTPRVNTQWELGSISANTGGDYDSQIYIRSSYIPLVPSLCVFPRNSTRVFLRCYNSSHEYVPLPSYDYMTQDFHLYSYLDSISTIQNIAYVRIGAGYTSEATITDVNALAENIVIRGLT